MLGDTSTCWKKHSEKKMIKVGPSEEADELSQGIFKNRLIYYCRWRRGELVNLRNNLLKILRNSEKKSAKKCWILIWKIFQSPCNEDFTLNEKIKKLGVSVFEQNVKKHMEKVMEKSWISTKIQLRHRTSNLKSLQIFFKTYPNSFEWKEVESGK